MLDAPKTIETQAQQAAVIPLIAQKGEIGNVMGPAIQEVMAAVQAQGVGPAGRLFSNHSRVDPEVFEFEVGIPVSAPITPSGRVQPGELPAARAISTVYHGGYEGLGAAWGEFMEWVEKNDLKTTGRFWEVYLTSHDTSGNPADWQTELNMELAP
jgi:effector-binding domain-containing protein